MNRLAALDILCACRRQPSRRRAARAASQAADFILGFPLSRGQPTTGDAGRRELISLHAVKQNIELLMN
jgi:hypothetical protein